MGHGSRHCRRAARPWEAVAAAVIVPVVLLLCGHGAMELALAVPRRVEALSVEKIHRLRAALKGGEPWLIGCLDKKGAEPPILAGLVGALQGKKYADSPDKYRVGHVNCRKRLPSGKSLKAKYGLKVQKGIPTLFFVANGRQPVQVGFKHFTKPDKKDKTKVHLAPKVLAEYVKKHAVPKVEIVASDTLFQKFCLKQKNGSVVVVQAAPLRTRKSQKKNLLSRAQTRVMTELMRQHRTLHICGINSRKWQLQFPGPEPRIEPPPDASLSGAQEITPPQIIFLGWGKNTSAPDEANAGTTKVVNGKFRHLNDDSKTWDAKSAPAKVAMSLCRPHVHSGMKRGEARKIFEKHRVDLARVQASKRPEAIFASPRALYRINGRYYTWKSAAPFFATTALFGGTLASDVMSRMDARVAHAEDASANKTKPAPPPRFHRYLEFDGDFNLRSMRNQIRKLVANKLPLKMIESTKRPKLIKYVSPEEKARKAKQEAEKKAKRQKKQRAKKMRKLRKKRAEAKVKKEKLEAAEKKRVERERKRRSEMEAKAQQSFVAAADDEDAEEAAVLGGHQGEGVGTASADSGDGGIYNEAVDVDLDQEDLDQDAGAEDEYVVDEVDYVEEDSGDDDDDDDRDDDDDDVIDLDSLDDDDDDDGDGKGGSDDNADYDDAYDEDDGGDDDDVDDADVILIDGDDEL